MSLIHIIQLANVEKDQQYQFFLAWDSLDAPSVEPNKVHVHQ